MAFLINRSFLRQKGANFCSCGHKVYNRGKWNYYSIKTNPFQKRRVLEERLNGEPDSFNLGPLAERMVGRVYRNNQSDLTLILSIDL